MKLELKNGIVETLFDYAFVVYTGPDNGRYESAIKGRPFMPKGTPVMIEKKFLPKALRTGLYAEWGSIPGQMETLEEQPEPETSPEEEPQTLEEQPEPETAPEEEPQTLEEALTAEEKPRLKSRRKFVP